MGKREPANELASHGLAHVEAVREPDDHRVEEPAQRLRHEDLVERCDVGYGQSRRTGELPRPAARGVEQDVRADRPLARVEADRPARLRPDPGRLDPERDLDAEGPDPLVEPPEHRERVERAVGGEERAADDPFEGDGGGEPTDPVRVDEPAGKALGGDDPVDRLQPVELPGALGQEQVAALAEPDVLAELGAEPPVGMDRLLREPHGRARLPLLPDPPTVAAGSAVREEPAVDHEDRPGTRAREVVGRVEPDDPCPDDDHPVPVASEAAHDAPGGPGPGSCARVPRATGTTGGRCRMYPTSGGGRPSQIDRRRRASGRQ